MQRCSEGAAGKTGRGHALSTDENLRPESKPDAIARLMDQIEIHEEAALSIAAETARLGLDAKKLKAIRAAKKTLDALLGIDAETAARVAS